MRRKSALERLHKLDAAGSSDFSTVAFFLFGLPPLILFISLYFDGFFDPVQTFLGSSLRFWVAAAACGILLQICFYTVASIWPRAFSRIIGAIYGAVFSILFYSMSDDLVISIMVLIAGYYFVAAFTLDHIDSFIRRTDVL